MFRHRKKKGQQLEIEEHEELMTFRGELTELPRNDRHESITPLRHRTGKSLKALR